MPCFVPLVSALPPVLPGNASLVVLEAGALLRRAAGRRRFPSARRAIERRDASAGLPATVTAIQRADSGPLWIAWTVPAVASREARGDRCGRWRYRPLRPRRRRRDPQLAGHQRRHAPAGDPRSQPGRRPDARRVHRRTLHGRCRKSAGLLAVRRRAGAKRRVDGRSSSATARRPARTGHARAVPASRRCRRWRCTATGRPMRHWPSSSSPDQVRDLRRDAAFWLGAARGDAGAAVVERLARDDADDEFREHLTFVLTLVGDRGLDTLIAMAKHDAEREGARSGAVLARAEGGPARRGRARRRHRRRPGPRGPEEGGVCAQPAAERRGRAEADRGRAHRIAIRRCASRRCSGSGSPATNGR